MPYSTVNPFGARRLPSSTSSPSTMNALMVSSSACFEQQSSSAIVCLDA